MMSHNWVNEGNEWQRKDQITISGEELTSLRICFWWLAEIKYDKDTSILKKYYSAKCSSSCQSSLSFKT